MTTKPVTGKYTDLSTPDSFQFVFHCDRCGAGALSERYAFNANGYNGPLGEKARALLWARQHDEAYERANNEARTDFNRCPVCGRWVCCECFYVSSEIGEAVTDICVDCKSAPGKLPRKETLLSKRHA